MCVIVKPTQQYWPQKQSIFQLFCKEAQKNGKKVSLSTLLSPHVNFSEVSDFSDLLFNFYT